MKPLTRRERDILRLVAAGLSNREIADALQIEERTVANYLSGTRGDGENGVVGIYRKLDIPKDQGSRALRVKATLWWLKHGEAA